MTTLSAEKLIASLELAPHPEGGFYRETYRAAARSNGRNLSTAIHFLLPRGHVSKFHRLASDEVWHYHLGGPLVVVEIGADGVVRETPLGPRLDRGEKVQHVVPAGVWFGAFLGDGAEFCLVGCTVAPGFEFADFEMATAEGLTALFPKAEEMIRRLT